MDAGSSPAWDSLVNRTANTETGPPIPEIEMALTYRQRFYCLVKPYSHVDECHIWEGVIDDQGYGIFRKKRAHRVAWELECSEIPADKVIRHYECDNRACVNIRHLRIGSQAENVGDMMRKGRHSTQNGKIYPSMVQHEILVRQLKSQIRNYRRART